MNLGETSGNARVSAVSREESASWSCMALPREGGVEGLAVNAASFEVALEAPVAGLDPLHSLVCGRRIRRVPILRVYGPSGASGQLCCLHIHGCFPYFFVPLPAEAYGESGASPSRAFLSKFARQLLTAADLLVSAKGNLVRKSVAAAAALCAESAFQNEGKKEIGRPPKKKGPPLLFRLSLVRRTPFYGFHAQPQWFAQVFGLDPSLMPALAALLLEGVVTGQPMQPHEVHVSFETQALADLGLRGMDAVYVHRPLLRPPVPLAVDACGEGALPCSAEARALAVSAERAALDPLPFVADVRSSATLGWTSLLKALARLHAALSDAASLDAPEQETSNDSCSLPPSSSSEGPVTSLCRRLDALPALRNSAGLRLLRFPPRQSKCALEADALASQVLNRALLREVSAATQRGTLAEGRVETGVAPETAEASAGEGASPRAFAIRVVESVSDLWAEETARCESMGLPLPDLPRASKRAPDAESPSAPRLYKRSLQRVLERVEAEASFCEGQLPQSEGSASGETSASLPLQPLQPLDTPGPLRRRAPKRRSGERRVSQASSVSSEDSSGASQGTDAFCSQPSQLSSPPLSQGAAVDGEDTPQEFDICARFESEAIELRLVHSQRRPPPCGAGEGRSNEEPSRKAALAREALSLAATHSHSLGRPPSQEAPMDLWRASQSAGLEVRSRLRSQSRLLGSQRPTPAAGVLLETSDVRALCFLQAGSLAERLATAWQSSQTAVEELPPQTAATRDAGFCAEAKRCSQGQAAGCAEGSGSSAGVDVEDIADACENAKCVFASQTNLLDEAAAAAEASLEGRDSALVFEEVFSNSNSGASSRSCSEGSSGGAESEEDLNNLEFDFDDEGLEKQSAPSCGDSSTSRRGVCEGQKNNGFSQASLLAPRTPDATASQNADVVEAFEFLADDSLQQSPASSCATTLRLSASPAPTEVLEDALSCEAEGAAEQTALSQPPHCDFSLDIENPSPNAATCERSAKCEASVDSAAERSSGKQSGFSCSPTGVQPPAVESSSPRASADAARAPFSLSARPTAVSRERAGNSVVEAGPSGRPCVEARRLSIVSVESDSTLGMQLSSQVDSTAEGCDEASAQGGAFEVSVCPFFRNPADVPLGQNPLRLTPGGRMLIRRKRMQQPPLCACEVRRIQTAAEKRATQKGLERAAAGRASPHLTLYIEALEKIFRHREVTGRRFSGGALPALGRADDASKVAAMRAEFQQRPSDSPPESRCYRFFLPPPSRARVLATAAPFPSRRPATAGGGNPSKKEEAEGREEGAVCREEEAPRKASRGSGAGRATAPLHKVATRVDNYGRVVACVVPATPPSEQQPKKTEGEEKKKAPSRLSLPEEPATPPSSAASFTDGTASVCGGEDSALLRSQASVASEVRRALAGLGAQQAKLQRQLRRQAAIGVEAESRFARANGLGTLFSLEVMAECALDGLAFAPTATAATAARPRSSSSAIFAVCFLLRDERLRMHASRLQSQAAEKKLQHRLSGDAAATAAYRDVSGAILVNPLSAFAFPASSSSSSATPVCSSRTGRFWQVPALLPPEWEVHVVDSERALLLRLCEILRTLDPSVLLHWQAARGFGFVIERAKALGLARLFSRRASRRFEEETLRPHLGAFAGGASFSAGVFRGSSVSAEGASRVPEQRVSAPQEQRASPPRPKGGGAFGGRVVLEVWRLLQKEMKLQHSELEGVALEVLGVTAPTVPPSVSAALWAEAQAAQRRAAFEGINSSSSRALPHAHRQSLAREAAQAAENSVAVLELCMARLLLMQRLVDFSEVLPRASALARLYGCSLQAALTRGTQFRVECVLLRAAKKRDFVLVSPSKQQVTAQAANICVPLILEPRSGFYFDPVLVLDFLSLYPSIVIANNICYSTALGNVQTDPFTEASKPFGVMRLHAPPAVFREIVRLHKAREQGGDGAGPKTAAVRVLPGGCMFVDSQVRRGIFPEMLADVIDTRVMIKQAMKRYKGTADDALLRQLDYRQYGLKMIANVSYGYTAASGSGRMPCADIADTIVQTARSTLSRAIETVQSNPKWNARVLYGDTDSMFVHLPGRSLAAAFEIGREIQDAITFQNPSPVTLQLEKVFLPCCLVSKKRYVGYAYSSPDAYPVFDAKGIETIRRDQCSATSSLIESSLRTLFDTRDLSAVKAQVYRHWRKMLSEKLPLRHFIFHRKVKLGRYKAERGSAPVSNLPPQAKVAYERLCFTDLLGQSHGGLMTAYGERVAFVFAKVRGATDVPPGEQGGARLLDCACPPERVWQGAPGEKRLHSLLKGAPSVALKASPIAEALENCETETLSCADAPLELHVRYYICRQVIPAMQRLFGLLPTPFSADLLHWFNSMPRPRPPVRPLESLSTILSSFAKGRRGGLSARGGRSLSAARQTPMHLPVVLQKLGLATPDRRVQGDRRLSLRTFFASENCVFCGATCKATQAIPLSKRAIKQELRSLGAKQTSDRRALLQLISCLRSSGDSSSSDSGSENMSLEKETPCGADGKGRCESRGRRCTRTPSPADPDSRRVQPPPVCTPCCSNPTLVALRLVLSLKKTDSRLDAVDAICRNCAGSRVGGAMCLSAWHCDVYAKKIAEEHKRKAVLQAIQGLCVFTDWERPARSDSGLPP